MIHHSFVYTRMEITNVLERSMFSSPFSKWQVTCTKEIQYMEMDMQCAGNDEGNLLRNYGNFNPQKISGLPTVKQADNIYILGNTYDSPNYNIHSNFSFRSLLEGFANPETGKRGMKIICVLMIIHIVLTFYCRSFKYSIW